MPDFRLLETNLETVKRGDALRHSTCPNPPEEGSGFNVDVSTWLYWAPMGAVQPTWSLHCPRCEGYLRDKSEAFWITQQMYMGALERSDGPAGTPVPVFRGRDPYTPLPFEALEAVPAGYMAEESPIPSAATQDSSYDGPPSVPYPAVTAGPPSIPLGELGFNLQGDKSFLIHDGANSSVPHRGRISSSGGGYECKVCEARVGDRAQAAINRELVNNRLWSQRLGDGRVVFHLPHPATISGLHGSFHPANDQSPVPAPQPGAEPKPPGTPDDLGFYRKIDGRNYLVHAEDLGKIYSLKGRYACKRCAGKLSPENDRWVREPIALSRLLYGSTLEGPKGYLLLNEGYVVTEGKRPPKKPRPPKARKPPKEHQPNLSPNCLSFGNLNREPVVVSHFGCAGGLIRLQDKRISCGGCGRKVSSRAVNELFRRVRNKKLVLSKDGAKTIYFEIPGRKPEESVATAVASQSESLTGSGRRRSISGIPLQPGVPPPGNPVRYGNPTTSAEPGSLDIQSGDLIIASNRGRRVVHEEDGGDIVYGGGFVRHRCLARRRWLRETAIDELNREIVGGRIEVLPFGDENQFHCFVQRPNCPGYLPILIARPPIVVVPLPGPAATEDPVLAYTAALPPLEAPLDGGPILLSQMVIGADPQRSIAHERDGGLIAYLRTRGRYACLACLKPVRQDAVDELGRQMLIHQVGERRTEKTITFYHVVDTPNFLPVACAWGTLPPALELAPVDEIYEVEIVHRSTEERQERLVLAPNREEAMLAVKRVLLASALTGWQICSITRKNSAPEPSEPAMPQPNPPPPLRAKSRVYVAETVDRTDGTSRQRRIYASHSAEALSVANRLYGNAERIKKLNQLHPVEEALEAARSGVEPEEYQPARKKKYSPLEE